MALIGDILLILIQVYFYMVIAMVIMSWLWAFDIVPRGHRVSIALQDFFDKTIERPILSKIRKFMPDMGGIDFSPLVLLIGLIVLRVIVIRIFYYNYNLGTAPLL